MRNDASVTSVKISKKSLRSLVAMVLSNVAVIVKNVN